MSAGRTLQPWAHRSGAYALPGSILVRLALGETPDRIPSALDTRRGAAAPLDATGIGAVDRIVASFGGAVRAERVHASCRGLAQVGRRHLDWSDDEQLSGVARLIRFDLAPGTHVGNLAISLLQLGMVEAAIPNYVATVGFDGPVLAPPVGAVSVGSACPARTRIRHAEALAMEPGDAALIVGVVDSGIAGSHPEFTGRTRSGFDTVRLGAGELAGGVELLGDHRGVDIDPTDRFVGHGSGCAAIIGANGRGMPPGLCGAAQLLAIRSLGAARFPGRAAAVGIGAIGDLDMGLKMAIDLGARVVNMSFGTDDEALEPNAPRPHSETVAYAARRGVILVAASGNSGDVRTYWPAAFPDVIAVGSVGDDGRPSKFSTRGAHVALCAPGERVLTATIDGYQNATGTSFAAPFVAGAAALLMARAARRSHPLQPAAACAILCASAEPWGRDSVEGMGAGVLNVAAALELLDAELDVDAIDMEKGEEKKDD